MRATPEATTPVPLVALGADDTASQALAEALAAQGWAGATASSCSHLVRDVVRVAPQALIVAWPADGAARPAVLQALDAVRQAVQAAPPVLLWGEATVEAEQAARLAPVGAMAHLGTDGRHLALNLALARSAQARWQACASDLAAARERLDERKWVDRAKGLLMQHQQLPEDAAFALLRTASMQANLRVGEVSRGLVEAAAAADAINRSGQLRMLSQRLVMALALGVAAGQVTRVRSTAARPGAASPLAAQARALLAETVQRLDDNLRHLQSLALPDGQAASDAREAVLLAWAGLRGCVPGPATPAPPGGVQAPATSTATLPAGAGDTDGLERADALAEDLLDAAEALTLALERWSGRRALQVVNLAGRQRMLCLRWTKLSLLLALRPAGAGRGWPQALVATTQALEQGLVQLQAMPLANDEIRETLAQARARWRRLQQAAAQMAGEGERLQAPTLQAAGSDSEALLASFDQLTSQVEHHMQVLLG